MSANPKKKQEHKIIVTQCGLCNKESDEEPIKHTFYCQTCKKFPGNMELVHTKDVVRCRECQSFVRRGAYCASHVPEEFYCQYCQQFHQCHPILTCINCSMRCCKGGMKYVYTDETSLESAYLCRDCEPIVLADHVKSLLLNKETKKE